LKVTVMPWIDAIAFDDVDNDDVIRWDHGGRTYAIYRTEDDEVFASDGLCTHEQVHLADGLLMGQTIECPKHNGRFDIRDGAPTRAPVCVALKTWPARVMAGRIQIDLPE
jgi:3-phenylpropionate/trans-cinnamate dioxygenase ferredoxin subunit